MLSFSLETSAIKFCCENYKISKSNYPLQLAIFVPRKDYTKRFARVLLGNQIKNITFKIFFASTFHYVWQFSRSQNKSFAKAIKLKYLRLLLLWFDVNIFFPRTLKLAFKKKTLKYLLKWLYARSADCQLAFPSMVCNNVAHHWSRKVAYTFLSGTRINLCRYRLL